MTVKIDKGIPIPQNWQGCPKYQWGEMEIGDSFLLDGTKSAPVNAHMANKRHAPKKFIARKVTENNVKRYRVWRIA